MTIGYALKEITKQFNVILNETRASPAMQVMQPNQLKFTMDEVLAD